MYHSQCSIEFVPLSHRITSDTLLRITIASKGPWSLIRTDNTQIGTVEHDHNNRPSQKKFHVVTDTSLHTTSLLPRATSSRERQARE